MQTGSHTSLGSIILHLGPVKGSPSLSALRFHFPLLGKKGSSWSVLSAYCVPGTLPLRLNLEPHLIFTTTFQ